jgi:hypothetical protein
MLKEFTRSLGLDPEKIIVRDALAEPHRAIATATMMREPNSQHWAKL